jgi:hypothetical protein
MIRRREVVRIAHADRLVVGDFAELRLALLERTEAEVRGDPELLGGGAPIGVVAGAAVDVAHDRVEVDLGGALASDATGEEDLIAMDRHLDADEGARLALEGRLHEAVGDGVAKLVGMAGQHDLGRSERDGHRDPPSFRMQE